MTASILAGPGGECPVARRLPGPARRAGPAARAALEEEIFGKHVLITDHDDWPAVEVIAACRSQSEAEFSFRGGALVRAGQ